MPSAREQPFKGAWVRELRRGGVSFLAACLLLTPAMGGGAGREAGEGLQEPPPRQDFSSPDDQLSQFIGSLLVDHPLLRSAQARWRSSLGRVAQEGSLEDPELAYNWYAQTPETRVGPQEQSLELSQRIPWFGKRRLQAQRAARLAESLAWRVQDIGRNLVAQLKHEYFDAAFLQKALSINQEETELLRRFEEIALTRYATGEGIQQSVVKVQTDISRLRDQKTSLKELLKAKIRRVAQLIGRPDAELALAPISLHLPELQYDAGKLEDQALLDHPRIQEMHQVVQADEVWSRRRILESRPDFRFGIGYTDVGRRQDTLGILSPPEENGRDSLALTVGLNLPLYRRRIRAGVTEAQESARANQERLQDAVDQLRYEIQEAVLRLESLHDRARLYKDILIPQAGESLGSAEAAYTTDRQDFLDLLDAERILFQVRLTYHRLLSDYWIALADLERGLGSRFPSTIPREEEEPPEGSEE
ncbi:MAG: TolC family protein [Acidobacteriota bacterium]